MNNKKENAKPKKTKTRAEKIFSVATSVLLAAAILFCGFVMIQIMRDGYVTIFGYSVFHVVSDSMEPTIPVGTLIISQKTDINDIKQRDIITFRSLDTYMLDKMVTHRVAEVKTVDGETALVTRGDNNNSVDAHYVTAKNLVGRVVYQTPGGNIFEKLYDLLTTKMGFLSIVVMPVTLLAAIILRENVKRIKREIANIRREVAKMQEDCTSDNATHDDHINLQNTSIPSPLSSQGSESLEQEAENERN